MSKNITPLHLDQLLGDLENKIMQVLWHKEKGTVREVVQELRKQREIAYTTVMTVMDNLFRKGYLTREKCGNAYCYVPHKPHNQFLQDNVAQIVDRLLSQYGNLATTHFINKLESIDPKLKRKLLEEIGHSHDKTDDSQ